VTCIRGGVQEQVWVDVGLRISRDVKVSRKGITEENFKVFRVLFKIRYKFLQSAWRHH